LSLSIGALGATAPVAANSFTNTTTAGSSTSALSVTYTALGPDSGTSNSINFSSNTTGINVLVPESLTFTNNGPTTVNLLPVPGVIATGDSTVPLKVVTNAKGGYQLSGCLINPLGLIDGSGDNILSAVNTGNTTLPATASAFAAQVAPIVGNGTAALNGAWATANGANYLGYNTLCGTTLNQVISKNTKPTSSTGDVLTITNAVMITGAQAAGTYTGTVDYLVSPSY
jgi:hypothetical protein